MPNELARWLFRGHILKEALKKWKGGEDKWIKILDCCFCFLNMVNSRRHPKKVMSCWQAMDRCIISRTGRTWFRHWPERLDRRGLLGGCRSTRADDTDGACWSSNGRCFVVSGTFRYGTRTSLMGRSRKCLVTYAGEYAGCSVMMPAPIQTVKSAPRASRQFESS